MRGAEQSAACGRLLPRQACAGTWPVCAAASSRPPWDCDHRARAARPADQVEREQGKLRVLVHCMSGMSRCGPSQCPRSEHDTRRSSLRTRGSVHRMSSRTAFSLLCSACVEVHVEHSLTGRQRRLLRAPEPSMQAWRAPWPNPARVRRSPAMVIAYLMKLRQWRLCESYKWVKDKRPSIALSAGALPPRRPASRQNAWARPSMWLQQLGQAVHAAAAPATVGTLAIWSQLGRCVSPLSRPGR